jgi:4-amino-4-deoxy-L-arabinose transferase-like glycosyltransferase
MVVYALHGYEGSLRHDLGVFTYGGMQVADGHPPYAGIFNSVGPLADLVPGIGIRLGQVVGVGPVLSERLLFTLLSAGCCALVLVLARDVWRSRAAGFVAAAAFLTFQAFTAMASSGPREKTTMVLFLLAALVLLGRRRWLAAGACTALATLAWQPVVAVAVAAAVAGLLTVPSGRWRAAAAYLVGGLVPTAVTAALYLAAGSLGLAFDGFWVINAGYTSQPSLLAEPGESWQMLRNGYGLSLWVILAGLLALLVLTVVVVLRRRIGAGDVVPADVVPVGVACAVALAWTVLVINGSPDVFVLLPFAAVGVAGAVLVVADALGRRLGRVLVVAVTATAVLYAGVHAAATRDHVLVTERRDVRAVLAAAPPGATLLSIDAPQVMALAGRDNPTRYQLFNDSMQRYLDHHLPGGLAGYVDRVERIHPTVLVTGRGGIPPWAKDLHRSYRLIGFGFHWTWYVARSAGPVVATAMQEAHHRAMRIG